MKLWSPLPSETMMAIANAPIPIPLAVSAVLSRCFLKLQTISWR